MSNSVEVPQHIQQALDEFAKKLLPAKLNTASVINGPLLSKWLREAGYVINSMTVKELAEALYSVTVAHVHERKLEWLVEPKVLRQREVEKFQRSDANEWVEKRNAQAQTVEQREAQAKEDGAAQNSINRMIENLSLTAAGRIQHAATSQAKGDLRQLEAALKKQSMPLSKVETKIRIAISKIYEAFELGQTDLARPKMYVRPW